jgi:hypothetical protein
MIIASTRKGVARGVIVLVTLLLLGAWNVQASASPVPFIESISPLSLAPGGAALTLTVTGTGFVSGSVVNFATTALATTYVSDTTVTAAVTATLIASTGTGWITVTNPGTPNRTSNQVFLQLANPSATLNFATNSYTTQASTVGVAQADFNGDGILDLVVSDYGSASLSLFLGNGDGTFQTAQNISLSGPNGNPYGVVVGDFNNDGNIDIAVGYEGSNISILLGNGNGTFQAPQTVIAGNYALELTTGDFNGDGNLDIAVTNLGGTVSVLLGKGDGTFDTAVTYTVPSNSRFIHTADLRGDGNLDLVVCSYEGADISVLLGNGDGTFQTAVEDTTGQNLVDVAIGDFNGDGKLDMIASSSSDNNVYLLLGNGDGTFQTAQAIAVGFHSYEIATADLNADGKLDLAMQTSTGDVATLLGNGDGTFQAPQLFAGAGDALALLVGNYVTGGGLGIVETDLTTAVINVWLQTVSLSPATFAFGNQALSLASTPQTFTLTNNTAGTVTISGVSFTGTNASDFADTTTCGATLASQASCTIRVTFTPAALGAASGTLTVTDSAPGGSETATLTGTGIDAPAVTLSSPSLSFQSSGVGVASAPQAVTVTNIGSATLNISGIAVTGANSADFGETTTCGATLATSATCTVNVTFTPSASGTRVAAVTLTDDAANSPQSIALTGSEALAATANLSAPSITFNGQVVGTTSAAQSVTLTNSGGAALTVASIAVSGANAGDFAVTNNCGASLAGGANCAIGATFKPSAGGTRTATMTITDSATSGTQTIALQGTGEDFSMAFTGGSTVASGLSENLTLTVTPQGGFTGTVALTCSGAPELSTCTVSPTTVALNGSAAATATFTLSTGGTAANLPQQVPPAKFPPAAIRWGWLFAALLMLAMVVLGLTAPKGRTLRPAALSFGVLLLLVAVGMSACVGITKHETIATTAPGTYTLTGTGVSGSLTNTATVGITVSK